MRRFYIKMDGSAFNKRSAYLEIVVTICYNIPSDYQWENSLLGHAASLG